MPLTSLKPFVPSGPDFERQKAFFVDLGFRVKWEVDGLAELERDGAAFLLQKFHNQEMQDNFMLYVTVNDVDAWWREIQDSGVLERYAGVRAKEPTDYPWGQREVHLVDPAGVCWHFG